ARLGVAALAAVTSACSSITFAAANLPTLFGHYERTTGIAYGTDPRQRLDVYVPKASGMGRPVVIFWYGGSWQMGDRSSYRFVGAALAERGFVTVLPDYRLYPQVKFPAFMDDGASAVAWVQQHASEFGGDPHRIVLMGHSAGAYMAAFLAKAGADPNGIIGLVGLSGPYALAPNSRVLNTIFAKPYAEADWQPVRFVTREAPPTFLAHGLDDTVVAVAHTESLRDALRADGVRVETHLYPGRSHADTAAGLSIPARKRVPVLEQTVQFIESVVTHCVRDSTGIREARTPCG
ncbi:MAG TPA: alpha/beta hydrolase, partial [Steroidobacteraceae bacterium]|nr:alpha/beta hydrolase [Steroidobacteraceae bacterium]